MEMEFSAEFRTVLTNLRARLQQPGPERTRLMRQRVTLDEVEAALERIEQGKYGICDSCFLVIPRRDLLDMPQRQTCSRCLTRAVRTANRADSLKAA